MLRSNDFRSLKVKLTHSPLGENSYRITKGIRLSARPMDLSKDSSMILDGKNRINEKGQRYVNVRKINGKHKEPEEDPFLTFLIFCRKSSALDEFCCERTRKTVRNVVHILATIRNLTLHRWVSSNGLTGSWLLQEFKVENNIYGVPGNETARLDCPIPLQAIVEPVN